jgi:hypothetical protein
VKKNTFKALVRVVSSALAWTAALPAPALELRQFQVAGKEPELREALLSASLMVVAAANAPAVTSRDIMVA